MMAIDGIPQAGDIDVERIASRLFDYITTECCTRHTLKIMICEALYEMRAVARGEPFEPVVRVRVATND